MMGSRRFSLLGFEILLVNWALNCDETVHCFTKKIAEFKNHLLYIRLDGYFETRPRKK